MARSNRRGGSHAGSSGGNAAASGDDADRESLGMKILSLAIAVGIGYAHRHHVGQLFENDRHFSHLSTLEREMTFRTEMGLYYSYYKTVVEAPSFLDGVHQLYANNLTEYPDTINTLKRFNLYPEVFLGGLFRTYTAVGKALGWNIIQCYRINRGENLSPVQSCDGMGDLHMFYITGVWVCGGLTAFFLYLQAKEVSGSILGGLLAVTCFVYNHGEATRIQWTPPLRESFAFPFCIAQMFLVTRMIKRPPEANDRKSVGFLAFLTCLFIIIWQFAQFALFSQLCSLHALFAAGIVAMDTLKSVLKGLVIGLAAATVLMFGNEMLFTSWFCCAVITSAAIVWLSEVGESVLRRLPRLVRMVVLGALLPLGTAAVKVAISRSIGIKDDAHVFNILRSKFTGYSDFHTLLYTCAKEFDFLGLEMPYKVTLTLLLPAATLAGGLVALDTIKHVLLSPEAEDDNENAPGNGKSNRLDAGAVYNVLQMVCYGGMAAIIMRLKLFFTPQMCVVAGLLASKNLLRPYVKSREMQLAALACLVAAMSVRGVANVREQYNILGEYSNPALEELIDWINANVPKEQAMAGPMPLMANLLLSTRRPVINHPHYEDAGLRERTRLVYTVYSRMTPAEVHEVYRGLGASIAVLASDWCLREKANGCAMAEVWDVEDPKRRSGKYVCKTLFSGEPAPFRKLFSNDQYVVLKV